MKEVGKLRGGMKKFLRFHGLSSIRRIFTAAIWMISLE